MKHVLGQLAGTRPGPILVVGGGIRALCDLKALGDKTYSAVISANGHAFKIPGMHADFIVCKDHYHTETKKRMEPQLREHGVPIISRHFWADYRVTEWEYQGNSGLMAILIATILGGGPIYPIGFDFYLEGTYWYDPNAKNVSKGRSVSEAKKKALRIAEQTAGTRIRPVSGPLCQVFPRPNNTKPRTVYQEPQIVGRYRAMPALRVKAVHELHLPFDMRARILPGKEFWISPNEYSNTAVKANVKLLDTHDGFVR